MDSRAATLSETCRHVGAFVVFVARRFPAFYVIVALTLFVLFLEYAATSLMIPIASSAPHQAMALWATPLRLLGLEPVSRTWLWLFLMVMTARLVFGYLQTVLTTLLGKQVHRFMSGRIYRHVVSSEPLTSIYTRSVGHYITLSGDDTFRCGTIISSLLLSLVGLFTALVAMVVLFQYSAPLFGALAVFLAVCAVTIGIMLRYLLRTNVTSNALSRELGTSFVESLNSLRSIRALHGERFVVASYAEQIRRYVQMLFRIDIVRTGSKAFPAVLLLGVGAWVTRPSSSLDVSEASLFAVTVIVIRIFAALGQFVASGSILMTDMRAVKDIETLIHDSETPEAAPVPNEHRPIRQLALRDVEFGYADHALLLSGMSCVFEHGKTYAVIGPSGSGKSTLADIMLGLLPPSRGRVEVNDGSLPMASVRGQIMLVEQQPKIFSSTLRENLLFGAQADDDKLWQLLDLVDLAASVRRLPGGLDTKLSYLGENFSGGQRQRIGIARALVRDPDVLLLDEATSALDPSTRSMVVGKLRAHMQDGIIIFITHDPDIAALADGVVRVGRPIASPLEAEPESVSS